VDEEWIAEPLSCSTEENIDEPSTFLFVDEEEQSTQEKENVHGSLISALSNLSIQYNLGVIAPALLLLDPSRSSGGTILPIDAAYPRSDEMDSILKTAVFAGAIFGQFTMGLLADAIGSLPVAMIITNLFALFGSIGWYDCISPAGG